VLIFTHPVETSASHAESGRSDRSVEAFAGG
jgi:hypothetical protein